MLIQTILSFFFKSIPITNFYPTNLLAIADLLEYARSVHDRRGRRVLNLEPVNAYLLTNHNMNDYGYDHQGTKCQVALSGRRVDHCELFLWDLFFITNHPDQLDCQGKR